MLFEIVLADNDGYISQSFGRRPFGSLSPKIEPTE